MGVRGWGTARRTSLEHREGLELRKAQAGAETPESRAESCGSAREAVYELATQPQEEAGAAPSGGSYWKNKNISCLRP